MNKLNVATRTENLKVANKIDEKIDSLLPGGSIILSQIADIKVVAERSGDGKKLTIYRETLNGFEVIQRTSF